MMNLERVLIREFDRREFERKRRLAIEEARSKKKLSCALKQRLDFLSKYDPSNPEILELDVAIMALELL